MDERRLGAALSLALAFALCCGMTARAQSGRARQSSRTEARVVGLSGREVKTDLGATTERRGETQAEGEPNRVGSGEFDVRDLNKGRRAPVAHSLDPELITFAVIMGMIVVILLSGRV
ncbi:MAG TPA: hypothetical protein VF791_17275 [Pyrinomonadaceae bacterium]